ncbi:TonB-dependent receptor plug domain-containing protein [Segatella bryantii]|nr:TonB-dependent receptor plug domain-containing protein [Segatella bryantii]UKK74792.1 TonB-dependent receptor plug domain-containing protein [Segatella bryantii]
MQNSTKTLSDALRQIPGLKLRETGGVGGSANIMLDGMDSKGENDCT